MNSLLDEISINTSPTDSENLRKLVDRNSRQIGFDHVIDVVEYDFAGMFTTFQTKDGLIIADNIVVQLSLRHDLYHEVIVWIIRL